MEEVTFVCRGVRELVTRFCRGGRDQVTSVFWGVREKVMSVCRGGRWWRVFAGSEGEIQETFLALRDFV